MSKFYKTLLLNVFFLIATLNTYSQISAIYSSTNQNTKTGTLDGVPFAFSNFVNNTQIGTFDYSGTDYSSLPLSSNQSSFEFIDGEEWTLTFDTPIQSLKLYTKFWRTSDIEFSQSFTIISGTGMQNPSGNILSSTEFGNGIIQFNNPITTLSIINNSGTFSGFTAMTIVAGDALLSTDDFVINKKSIKLFPNPSTDYIQISGLTKKENYKIYSILGNEIKSGNILKQEQIDIQNLTNGLYFLKFEDGNTIKFLKE